MNKIKDKQIKFFIRRGLIFAFCLFTFSLTPLPAAAHRYHTSLTRIDYKAEDQNIEITIQLFTHDLEKVLERFAKKRVDLDKASETDKLIEKYLEENFALQNSKGERLKIRWVGKELDVDTISIYLEAYSETSIAGFKLQNTIFFESFPEQTNLIIARFDNKKVDLLFKTGNKFKTI